MLSIEHNISAFLKDVAAHQKALGFAEVVALTRTAKATAHEFLPAEAARVFDRPTRWTTSGFRYFAATPDKKVFSVAVKDFAGKGVPASKYLQAQVMGGGRRQKRSEVALTRRGLMGNKGYWVPGPGIQLDPFGNVPGGTMRRIISDLQADAEVGYQANRTARSTKRNKRYRKERYFIPRPGSKLHPGVWVRRGEGIAPALLFVTGVSYKARFDFFGKGMQFARERFLVEINRAVAQGYAKPKP